MQDGTMFTLEDIQAALEEFVSPEHLHAYDTHVEMHAHVSDTVKLCISFFPITWITPEQKHVCVVQFMGYFIYSDDGVPITLSHIPTQALNQLCQELNRSISLLTALLSFDQAQLFMSRIEMTEKAQLATVLERLLDMLREDLYLIYNHIEPLLDDGDSDAVILATAVPMGNA